MAFEGLSDKLSAAFKRLRNKGKLNEADVKEAMREVRLALLEADVNYKVAKDFTNSVTQRAIGSQVLESLTPAQMVIKIVNEELTALMGGEAARLATANRPPCIVMMCGLQGSGKTTHSGKLGLMLKKQGTGRCWWPATSTAPPPSPSCRWWGRRPASRCLRWARQTRWTSPKRRWLTPGITATTM